MAPHKKGHLVAINGHTVKLIINRNREGHLVAIVIITIGDQWHSLDVMVYI